MRRTFGGALVADVRLSQYLSALDMRSGSINTVNELASRILGRPFDMRRVHVRVGLDEIKRALVRIRLGLPVAIVMVSPCYDCNGTGLNPHGNECEFCDGYGEVEDHENDSWSNDNNNAEVQS